MVREPEEEQFLRGGLEGHAGTSAIRQGDPARDSRKDRPEPEKQGRIHRLEHADATTVTNVTVRRVRERKQRPDRGKAGRPEKYGARPMRIERRNTVSGQSPYAGIDFRLTTSEIKNPD